MTTLRGLTVIGLTVGLLTGCSSLFGPSANPSGSPGSTPSETPAQTSAPATPSATSSPTASPTPSSTGSPTAVPSSCSETWGTNAKTDSSSTTAPVTGVRSGRHDCFDRLVVDIHGDAGGFDVRYVPAVVEEGRGEVVNLRGGAFLQVVVLAPAYDPMTGKQTYTFSNPKELVDVGGYTSFRQVAWGGSFEGHTLLGVGMKAKLPFRVFTLTGPGSDSRIVVDVAH